MKLALERQMVIDNFQEIGVDLGDIHDFRHEASSDFAPPTRTDTKFDPKTKTVIYSEVYM